MPANTTSKPQADQTQQHNGTATATPAVEPLLVPAAVAGPMCGRSKASWWRDCAAGRTPAPIKLAGSTLWSVEELKLWIAHSCPPRKVWEAIKAGGRGGRS
jgi:predicted DNA-binding transcriptional regulator AlpA